MMFPPKVGATRLIRLDMSLTGLEFRAAVVLVSAGPALTAVAAQQWRLHTVGAPGGSRELRAKRAKLN